MKVEGLSGVDAEVYQTVAELEGTESAPLQDIARHVGLQVEEAHAALHRLMSDPGLVREMSDATQPDLVPCTSSSPASD